MEKQDYTQHWSFPNTAKDQNTLFKNARIIDPESNSDFQGDLLVIDAKIADFSNNIESYPENTNIIDCTGLILCPGLIDIHVHFREPGHGHKETIETGSKSAAAGGITSVVCQPNTNPVLDNITTIEYLKARAAQTSYINIYTYAAISKGLKDEELTDMGKLVEAGVLGFTDDGLPVMNSLLMRHALEYSKMLGVPIAQHAEDPKLSQCGCMNESIHSFRMGLRGIPNISESTIVERDIAIAELTDGHYHVLHISTAQAIEAVRRAKAKGINVTCEVAPHHFTLSDEATIGYKTFAKMNPPLRSEKDRMVMVEALKDGTIDVIATDHAPHDQESKRVPFSNAAFGIVGVETMLPLSLALYHQGHLSLMEVLSKMTNKPAKLLKIDRGQIKKGMVADLTLFDLDMDWEVDVKRFASKSHNSPFDGWKVKGRAMKTMVAGNFVYEYNK